MPSKSRAHPEGSLISPKAGTYQRLPAYRHVLDLCRFFIGDLCDLPMDTKTPSNPLYRPWTDCRILIRPPHGSPSEIAKAANSANEIIRKLVRGENG